MYTVKTRLHLYPGRFNNVFDCARTIFRHEGLRGLYRGLPPALVGVFPEKAIKLSMNDYLSAVLSRPDGSISIPMAMLAGGGAGFSQVVVTNPMELVMINMQNNAAKGAANHNMFRLARDLGLAGLYRGTQATLLRDIPFSMIFFSMNTYLREHLRGEDGKLQMRNVFLAGIASGSTAAFLSTPMDVIKTRLQAGASAEAKSSKLPATHIGAATTSASTHQGGATDASPVGAPDSSTRRFSTVARRGLAATASPPPTPQPAGANAASVQYTGIAHCARHIYAREGVVGFFAGAFPRVLIISPLFGITLFFYDVQRRLQESGRI